MRLFNNTNMRTAMAYTNTVGDKVYPVIVDIKKGIKSTEEILFVSSDINTGILSVAFIQGNDTYNVAGAEVVCSIMRPDASTLDIPCTIVENNIVEVPLGVNGTSQDGVYSFDFKVFKGGNKVVGTPTMNYSVSLSISNDNAVLEDDRLPVLTMLMTQVSELHDRTDEAVVKANTATEATKEATAKAIEATNKANETVNKVTQDTANAIADVNATSDTMVENVNNAISSMDTTVNSKISEMTDAVNNKISEVDTAKNDMITDVSSTKANMVTEVTNAKNEMTATVTNKVNEVEGRFNALTASQQQSSEVIDARDGETSLKARLDRDIEKAKQIYVGVEGSHISTDSSSGYLKDVEILGNTIQDTSNLADIRSVGDTVEGQELYEIPVLSRGKNLFNPKEHSIDTYTYNSPQGSYLGRKIKVPKPNTKYTLSVKESNLPSGHWVVINAYENGKILQAFNHNTTGSNSNSFCAYVITTSDENGYIQITVYVNNRNDSSHWDAYLNLPIQLEEGTQATPYEPYVEDKLTILSPTPLEKVGDVADRIIEKDGVWGVEKNVGNYIFKGNEVNANQGVVGGIHLWYWSGANQVLQNKNNATTVIHTKLPHKKAGASNTGYEAISFNGNGVNLLIDTKQSTMNEANEFIRGSKLMYILANPQFIPLPHSQQVKLRTFANKTNISFLTEIEGTIKAQVPKSLGATVNTHTTQIDNLNKELDRVKKLEESTVSTVTTESDFTTVEATSNGYFEDVKLEGKTLVNLFTRKQIWNVGGSDLTTWSANIRVEVGKQYTLIVNGLNETKANGEFYITGIGCSRLKNNSVFTPQTIVEGYTSNFYIYGKTDTVWTQEDANKIQVLILEGDHTQNPPSYFEGLKSVGDGADEIVVSSVKGDGNLFDRDTCKYNTTILASGEEASNSSYVISDFIKVNGNTSYYVEGLPVVVAYDSNKNFIKYIRNASISDTFTTDFNCSYVKIRNWNSLGSIELQKETVNSAYLIKGTTPKQYTPHQSDKKRLLYYNEETQTWEKPVLREWDSIEKHSNGKYYYHQRSGEVVFNGSESWEVAVGGETEDIITYRFKPCASTSDGVIICDKFKNQIGYKDNIEGIYGHANGMLYLSIQKTKASNIEGLKVYLQTNNVTVVYQLAEEKVYECTNIDLITYANETNYIVESGAIAPKSILKVHNNISNVVKILQEKVSLLESNVKASQEVQDMMILETDMRMLDIELALMEFAPMKLNLGGSDMLRSATYFNFLKNHIINETYEKGYLENVMNKYLATGRINQDEYDELYKMLYPPVYDIELPIEL